MKQKVRDPNDNTLTRLIILLLILLLAVAVIAVVTGVTFAVDSNRQLAGGDRTDYSLGAGLCFLAAVGALATGLLAAVKLAGAWR